jgi:hypothetical protein
MKKQQSPLSKIEETKEEERLSWAENHKEEVISG